MASDTDVARVSIEVNSKKAESEIERLQKKSEELRKKFDKAFADGDTKGVKKLGRELKRTGEQLDQARIKAGNLRVAMKDLSTATPKDLQRTIRTIYGELNSGKIARGSKEWDSYVAALKRAKAELKKVQAEMQVTTGKATKLRDMINNWGASIAAGAAAFAGIVMSGKAAVQAYADMEQEEANVRKFTGMTAEQVTRLNDEFKKMDTRTSREELNKLAQEAGRLGKTSQEDVLGFVRAADKINVALDDLGDGATLTLSKLTGIFGDEKIYGTEQSLLKVGSVINELSQNCSASAPYLAEFASRMGGVAAQSGMTIQQVMAFGAVLDTNNQAVEASATALSQVLVRLYQEPAKYAKVAGLDVKKFSDLMKKDANAALLLFLETLQKAGGMDVLSPMFKDMGETGSRAISALSTLAGNIAAVKWQQEEANKAFAEGTSVGKEFDVQNNTVQAGLDKARKGFNEMAIALGKELLPVMRYCISGTSMLMRTMLALVNFFKEYKKEIVVLTLTIVAYHTAVFVATGRMKALALAQLAAIKSSRLLKVTMALLSPVFALVTNAVQYFTNGLQVNYAMQQRWHRATARFSSVLKKINPTVFAVTTAVAALGGAYALMSKRTSALAKVQKELDDIMASAMSSVADKISVLDKLYKKTQDANLTIEERTSAINALRNLYPDYFKDISNEAFLAGQAADAYNRLKTAIIESAKAKGREGMIAKLEETLQNLQQEYQDKVTPFMKTILEAQAKALTSPGDIQNDPNYVLAKNSLATIKQIYEPQIAEIKKKQEELAELNANYQLSAPSPEGTTTTMTSTPQKPYESEEERKKRLKEQAKEAREAAKQAKAELLLALSNAAAARDMELAENTAAYTAGLKDYRQYLEDKYAIEMRGIAAEKKVYEDRGKVSEKEYGKLIKKEQDMLYKHLQEKKKMKADDLKRTYDEEKDRQTMQFFSPGSAMYQNEKAYKQKIFELDIKYLEEKKNLYTEGSKEWADIEIEIQKKLNDDKLQKQKELATAYEQFLKQYENASGSQREANELAMMKGIYDAKLITEEQYQQAVADIKEKYLQEDRQRLRKTQSEYADMCLNVYDSFKKLFADIKDGGKFSLDNLAAATSAAFAAMTAAMQSYSSYMNAERDAELAKVEARYDKEIAAAGNNTKKKEKLEKQKEAETAKLKKKYNDRAMKIEIAQAIAQTAMSALNAYASTVVIPIVGPTLAPIAAAVATAFGMMQVAAIKKQHQAESAGYYSGGFTRRDPDNRREVGVVHANEFVANHEAVANPAVAPVLRLLDYAQRNNTVGSLTAADVSNAIGQGAGVSARGVVTVPTVSPAAAPADNSAIEGVLSGARDAIEALNRNIAEGIETVMVMDGEKGFDRKYSRYNRLRNNPHR